MGHKICSRNGGTVAKGLELKAECVVQARTTCKEVCAQSRFCNFGNSGLGKLVQREHGNRLHKNGRVCCFDKCRVPQSWGLEVKPHLWCNWCHYQQFMILINSTGAIILKPI